MLTITIPTYNRNEILANNLKLLVPQLNSEARLIIIDNHSLIPISDTIKSDDDNYRIIRNKVNVGGNANILKCFECCETEWIWILGDDDMPTVDAVEKIINAIKRFPNSIMIGFCKEGEGVPHEPVKAYDIVSLLKSVHGFGDLLFVSTSVYRASALRAYMDFGYHYAYSCAPHLVLLLMQLSRTPGECVMTRTPIILYDRPVIENRGSLLPIGLGLPVLLELPIDRKSRRGLAQSLGSFPRVSAIAHQLLLQIVFRQMPIREARQVLHSTLTRISWRLSPRRRLIGCLWMLSLLCPSITYALIRPLYKRMTGHETGPEKIGLSRL